MTDGVPNDILRKVRNMDIRSAAEFTAYPEGSPRHPSWPAMHAANGCSSYWMSVVLNLNPQQLCQLRLVDYDVAFARTVAVSMNVHRFIVPCYQLLSHKISKSQGVHYPDDNTAGLNLAQEVVARSLPRMLRDKYNANPRAVASKARRMRYDWDNFDDRNPCPFDPSYRSNL